MSRTWFNGALVEGPLSVERGERGLLLGDGLFISDGLVWRERRRAVRIWKGAANERRQRE